MMTWLAENWVWLLLGIGAVWMFSRGGLAGCAMGGHGSHAGHGGKTGSAAGESAAGTPGLPRAQAIPDKAVDPVSGQEVLPSHAMTAAYQGRLYYFESDQTRHTFEQAPQQYVPNAAAASQERQRHGCC
jgi:YHS domain-containing protein